MGDGSVAAPVIAGLAIGIAFVIAFTLVIANLPPKILTVADESSTFHTLSANMTIIEEQVDDIDGCCDEIGIVTFSSEPHFGVRDSQEVDEGQ